MNHRQDFRNDGIKRPKFCPFTKAAKQGQEIVKNNFSRAFQINHRLTKTQQAFIY